MVNMRAGLPRLGTVCDEYRLGDLSPHRLQGGSRCVIDACRRWARKEAHYLHLSVTASVRFPGFTIMITSVWGCLSLFPVP